MQTMLEQEYEVYVKSSMKKGIDPVDPDLFTILKGLGVSNEDMATARIPAKRSVISKPSWYRTPEEFALFAKFQDILLDSGTIPYAQNVTARGMSELNKFKV